MTRKRDRVNDDEFAGLFAAECGAVVRLAYALVGDADLAQDLAADAFARTYEQWRRGRVREVGPYVRQAVANRARDYFRRAERQRRQEHRRGGDDRGQPTFAEHIVMTDEVQRLLRELPARQRAAVVLRYWADYTDVGVAAALDVPLGTAKSLLRRARLTLEAAVARSEGAGPGPTTAVRRDSSAGCVSRKGPAPSAPREQGDAG